MERKFNLKETSVIFGLGNPGIVYKETFHNVGFQFVKVLGKRLSSSVRWKKHSSGLFQYTKEGSLILVLPLVFMNESGSMVSKAVSFFKTKPETIAIAHDDSDILMGSYKITLGGGSAGHKGIGSIYSSVNTQSFWRIRIGIRNPKEKIRKKASSFVLSKETAEEKEIFCTVFETILKKEFLL